LDIPLPTSQGLFQDLSVSFAIDARGNGYTLATLFYSTDGGVNFTNSGNSVVIPNLTRRGGIVITLPVPAVANNVPDLVVRIQFNGGQSNGGQVQDIIDNIRVGGTIVPEPTNDRGWAARRPRAVLASAAAIDLLRVFCVALNEDPL